MFLDRQNPSNNAKGRKKKTDGIAPNGYSKPNIPTVYYASFPGYFSLPPGAALASNKNQLTNRSFPDNRLNSDINRNPSGNSTETLYNGAIPVQISIHNINVAGGSNYGTTDGDTNIAGGSNYAGTALALGAHNNNNDHVGRSHCNFAGCSDNNFCVANNNAGGINTNIAGGSRDQIPTHNDQASVQHAANLNNVALNNGAATNNATENHDLQRDVNVAGARGNNIVAKNNNTGQRNINIAGGNSNSNANNLDESSSDENDDFDESLNNASVTASVISAVDERHVGSVHSDDRTQPHFIVNRPSPGIDIQTC